ncbi:MAG TPA: S9 family peptidase [Herpetosiphonaceae bacterium]|nr:S9 family peptidase [Herpetosiphonaceae bacterium]
MNTPTTAPYGSWPSPLTADTILAGTVSLREGPIVLDGDDIYWTEGRPDEGGRNVIVRRGADGQIVDVNPAPLNARTRVHEYGGGAFTVEGGTVFMSSFADGRLYRIEPGAEPRPITPEGALRHADLLVDRRRGRLLCVREDHRVPGREAANMIVSVDLDGGREPEVLIEGNDFYAAPRLSPDGTRLAWLTWNHPNMPWDGTELWVAEVRGDGSLGGAEHIAGSADVSISEPVWSPDRVLHFISEQTGWWNIHRQVNGRIEPLIKMKAEFGGPQWIFGLSSYAFESPGSIVCRFIEQGWERLATVDCVTRRIQRVDMPYTTFAHLRARPGSVVFVGASPTELTSIIRLHLDTRQVELLRHSREAPIDEAYLSLPEAIEFPTEGGLTAHGFFYAPRNPLYRGPEGERPPLIVMSHGGPTGATTPSLNLHIQYWTSRGIAVLDVNYGGSTGYGRDYRRRLDCRWGIVDIDDCVNGARSLVECGAVDGNRLAITGGSAGGYTTLGALTFRDVFQAGASHFGLSDLEAFMEDTHKFESRYLERLVAPYPERRDVYRERSPIHFADRLDCALILFQGLDDKIVLPNQAEMMFEAVRDKGLPAAYLPFDGEGHGFRRRENVKRALEAELYFYGRVFGFEPADEIEPIPIENLEPPG